MSVSDVVVLVLAALGALLLLISAVGTARLQGVHQRLQAASIGMSVGITLLLLSAGIHFIASAEMGLMILLIILFAVTSPIATTAMARAAYRRRPNSTHGFLTHDDMADPAYTPDYSVREAVAGQTSAPATDAHTQTAADQSAAKTTNP